MPDTSTIEFLLGPAGTGKTHTCIQRVRDLLVSHPDGPPLLWIAPKQATFQIERRLLAAGVPGFTRLVILPFDRLARRILEGLGHSPRHVLSEEGRVMVLRALLLSHESDLRAFRASARAIGFATQLSQVLRELHRVGAGLSHLRNLSLPTTPNDTTLADKIHDLSLLLTEYQAWLQRQQLHDPDELLVLAASQLTAARSAGSPVPTFAGLWLDGFAEMTQPEVDLLAAVLPGALQATLAFCLQTEPADSPAPDPPTPPNPPSPSEATLWSVTRTTYLRCLHRVRSLGLPTLLRTLPADGSPPPRYLSAPDLARLATHWNDPFPPPPTPDATPILSPQLHFVECLDPAAEASLAARWILRHVHQHGGRFRDVSVTVRRMEDYGHLLAQAFRRHQIPFFADLREPMGHHPIAELTRCALRIAAGGWALDDWLGALKTGLVVAPLPLVDHLENLALQHGLRGDAWLHLDEILPPGTLSPDSLRLLTPALEAFRRFLPLANTPIDGPSLALALRTLWSDLEVPSTLARWQAEAHDLPPLYRAIHHTAWEEMLRWVDDVERAFTHTTLPAWDWVAITEAGLSSLTLGVIPPALDQVMVGAVDRSRQPEVTLALVLGFNEGVFPAPPPAPALLHRGERETLAEAGLDLGWGPLSHAARELYYAYIAATRPSQTLVLCWSRRGTDGRTLSRSPILERLLTSLRRSPPQPPTADDVSAFDGHLLSFSGHPHPHQAQSISEFLECPGWDRFVPPDLPPDHPLLHLAQLTTRLREQLLPTQGETLRRLPPDTVLTLYPNGTLTSSVSALEDFAECPFRHFASRQLRLAERQELKVDPAGTGTLLHAVLKQFHEETLSHGGRWRDWPPDAAAQRILELGESLLATPEFAAHRQDPLVTWESQGRLRRLAQTVAQLVAWMASCSFDPVLAEFQFGPPTDVPPWTLDLPADRTLHLRGSIDRIDLCQLPDGRRLIAVIDYKSSARSPTPAGLAAGIELQLLGYLAFAVSSPDLQRALPSPCPSSPSPNATLAAPSPPEPAGAFYIPLSPGIPSADRDTPDPTWHRKALDALVHSGRGNSQFLVAFDPALAQNPKHPDHSRQFKPRQFLSPDAFHQLLLLTTTHLRQHATRILDGHIGVQPLRFGPQKTACDHCPFRPVCRFEPRLGGFRSLASALASAHGHSHPTTTTGH